MNRIPRRQFLQQATLATAVVASDRLVGAADAPAELATSPGPGVRFAVRGPFSTDDLRKRALLLQRLGYEGIELGEKGAVGLITRGADCCRCPSLRSRHRGRCDHVLPVLKYSSGSLTGAFEESRELKGKTPPDVHTAA